MRRDVLVVMVTGAHFLIEKRIFKILNFLIFFTKCMSYLKVLLQFKLHFINEIINYDTTSTNHPNRLHFLISFAKYSAHKTIFF